MATKKKRSGYVPARKNDPEGVRARFLDVAAELFQSRGYCATGMQAIFEEAGVTAGAFYHHFESKKDLANWQSEIEAKLKHDMNEAAEIQTGAARGLRQR